MKRINIFLIAMAMVGLSSCSVVGDIFKAGYYVGIIVVLIVIGLIWWLVSMFRK
ncbi:phosphatidate cytidylyltransferase [Mucilaginibacter limnophilus]|uniref:Phosphatidate cytidylyltransferase n=1 Tax=Mucilaginibacter limnophilus TaxID=1932778 RepID=A0A3S2V7N0_9SPHI|nr:phosphatidate cytidylyltransferase [Mucilaginibacter limnophilus]RVU00543.1 phosphatidate cytidylyltransferase [Mucilaginibacter limnophilus]